MNTLILKSIQVQGIRSIALTVKDADKAKDFYLQALKFEVVSDVIVERENYNNWPRLVKLKMRLITLKLGDEQIELIQYLNIEGKSIPSDSRCNDLWFQHLAIVVSDMERAYAHLKSFPIESISTEPQTFPLDNVASANIRAFKFKDPDRHNLELIWFPPEKGQEKWQAKTDRLFLGIDHSAIVVTNTERSVHFYREMLGMQVVGGGFNYPETQARLDDLPNATVKVTALRPSQGGIGIELLDYVLPTNGRSIPDDWKSWDIAYVQVELVIDDIKQAVNYLQQNKLQLVQFTNSSLDYENCLIKDPDGHALLLRTSI